MFSIFKSFLIRFKQKIRSKLFGSKLGWDFGKTNLDNKSLDFLIENFKIKSFIDIGSGKGALCNQIFYESL